MADTKITISLNGDDSSQVRELHDIELLATFENGNAQANISITEFEFVNDFAKDVRTWIDNGLTTGLGIFEGIPLSVTINGDSPNYLAFNGHLDMTDEFEIVNPTIVKGKIKKDSGLQNLDDLASGLTFYYLFEIGVLTLSDMEFVPYIIEKEFDPIAFLLIILSIYTLATQIISLIKELAQSIASGITAPILFALDVIYALLLIVYLTQLIIDLVRMIVEPIRYTRGIRLKTLLEIGSSHLGFGYNSSVSEINQNKIMLIPSKNSVDEQGNAKKQSLGLAMFQNGLGIPNARDFGYTFGEILQLVNKTFNCKIGLKNGVIEQHSQNASWWIQQSTYQIPDLLWESQKFNTDELTSNFLLTFTPDSQDKNVMENYKGTSYEVITTPINVSNPKNVALKGLDEIDIPYALGIRKTKTTFIEDVLDIFIATSEELTDLVNSIQSGNATQIPAITGRIGCVKFGTDFLNIPKMLYMNDVNQLPSNYHDLWSAKVLWNKYHSEKSFVGNNFTNTNQWRIYEGVRVPFGFSDFLKLIDNSYFYDIDGNTSQVVKIQWSVSKDFAIMDFRVNKIYTKNLQETFIEVGGDDTTGENFE
tara:strand:- start:6114 stop:7886 length:1773 start_codon:yes stop_codon:yes gene_type:complete